jgi:hypothetical protein
MSLNKMPSVFTGMLLCKEAGLEHAYNKPSSILPVSLVINSCLPALCPAVLLHALQLGCRLAHILRRIMPISMYLLQKDGQCLSGHDLLLRRISSSFQDFIEEVSQSQP